ncbi:hypothetical protein ACIQB5_15660 [Streptomyces sp. NPDC088560]|uniref:hypothetical protein n=1 Tax=Streptomyces sp. NPDC088560 TaxID=3365868 RepID=UPI003827E660
MPSMDGPREYVDLGRVSPETAAELARLIQRSMRRAYRTVDSLRAVFEARGLAVPGLAVWDGRIDLGDVSIETADRLACLLGAPPQPGSRMELSEWSEAHEVVDRLGDAFKTATRGGFLDLLFHPDCLRCDALAAVRLGSIPVKSARRLATAIESGGRP